MDAVKSPRLTAGGLDRIGSICSEAQIQLLLLLGPYSTIGSRGSLAMERCGGLEEYRGPLRKDWVLEVWKLSESLPLAIGGRSQDAKDLKQLVDLTQPKDSHR